jgi:asparagine synthase (glutamine-hydrolysing)
MTFFACAVQLDGSPVPESFRTTIQSARYSRGKRVRWYAADGFLGVLGIDHGALKGATARLGSVVVIGVARLDNRREIASQTHGGDTRASDLELILRYVAAPGARLLERIGQLLGDFAFVIWNAATRELVAARDTFGVKTLYYATRAPDTWVLSSRAELLAVGDEYELEYLVGRLAESEMDPSCTVYSGVRALSAASVLSIRCRRTSLDTFWSAQEAQQTNGLIRSVRDQVDAFRTLMIDAVRRRMSEGPETWSHLSGGLDSSSVVSIAQSLVRTGAVSHGLGGTVTFVDPFGTGADEKEYSDAIVAQYGLRNEAVPHRAEWTEVLRDPPYFDQPNRSYPVAVRDRHATSVIRNAGGTVLLTGIGGDHLLLTTMFFFADWLARGDIRHTVSAMARWSALGRVSFWELAFKNGMLPLLPGAIRRAVLPHEEAVTTPWLTRPASVHAEMASLRRADRFYDGRIGHKYADAIAVTVSTLPFTLPDRFGEEVLDIRHPFLDRSLVELALRLPPELCARPHQRKWVLREAMTGILPEAVRIRVGKGGATGLIRRALVHERSFIRAVMRDPILAQLGCIDARKLRTALEDVDRESQLGDTLTARAHTALDVELWLQLRAGRWAATDSQDSGAQDAGNGK